ncbi:MAG TPA: peroxidase family protein [Candidatus Acidoferrum sp.]|nr:peroxidase family protein [Candidatus Acidoferrum sp.]
MTRHVGWLPFAAVLLLGGCGSKPADLFACVRMSFAGFRPIANERDERFLGKVQEDTARCRGGARAVARRGEPWIDWARYWATGDGTSRAPRAPIDVAQLSANGRGVDGALLDLEYQRIELIKFNLFDNAGTYPTYVAGRDGVEGPALETWNEMHLPREHPQYAAVGGDGRQRCWGELARARTLTGICNDLDNPLMGSVNQPFARNVSFEATFPDLGKDALARNRHGGRIGLLTPDPQLVSRLLFRRTQVQPDLCRDGRGLPGDSAAARCDYKPASSFNVLAAFWIQFMTHDWFSHLEEGRNAREMMSVGCVTPAAVAAGCRPGDGVDRAVIAQDGDPATFTDGGKRYLSRAYKTTRNTVTAWWDASQIYGSDETSRRRVKRDPNDPARLLVVALGDRAGAGERQGYLPVLQATDPMNPQWAGQEAVAFPDNWSIGLSVFHTVFAREHNLFVDEFRRRAAMRLDEDSGLRHPARPDVVIRNRDVTSDELFDVARLVIAALIAKIHTTEWTPQLLYDEPLFLGMNGNWSGLFRPDAVRAALEEITVRGFRNAPDAKAANQWYSVFASGSGILGLGSFKYAESPRWSRFSRTRRDVWRLTPEDANGGVNHFGSPFNFPEEFVTVYRLHPMMPDLIEFRRWDGDPNVIRNKIGVVQTFRGLATGAMRDRGLANWALSMGRQRLGQLALRNHPMFLQDLELPRLRTPTGKIDVAALDLIRDRERGVPRFNEFRRQYGLRQLTSFDDFVDPSAPDRAEQETLATRLRELYGQHRCEASKPITAAQRNADGSAITDCLGRPDGSLVDNVEDLDTVVGWLAEPATRRPHGFAISETQFQVFILNASRRLFSDRFFTSSFRPEFYTTLGIAWVNQSGPERMMEKGTPNGHAVEVAPLKRVLMRTVPELDPELANVVNTFDPWARNRGEYYSLDWKPRPGAESDPAFTKR